MSWKPGLTKVYVVVYPEQYGDPAQVSGVFISRKAAERFIKDSRSSYEIEEHDLVF